MLVSGIAAVVAAYMLSANVNRALDTANRRLKEQNMLFDAALNNMLQGLAMFDARERLLVSNNRFIEMYGLSREVGRAARSLSWCVIALRSQHSNQDPEEIRRELSPRAEGRTRKIHAGPPFLWRSLQPCRQSLLRSAAAR